MNVCFGHFAVAENAHYLNNYLKGKLLLCVGNSNLIYAGAFVLFKIVYSCIETLLDLYLLIRSFQLVFKEKLCGFVSL